MYDYIKGTLTEITPNKVTVETYGVGYLLFIPLNIYSSICSSKGKEITLYTSFVVREDSHRLFGFLHKQEREVFEKLSEISGIGPKTALGIIGHLSLEELDLAIYEQDVITLSKVPGIGKKTAERLIIEMKDKLSSLKISSEEKDSLSSESSLLLKDASSALMNLGYAQAKAHEIVKKALKTAPPSIKLAELLSLSLKLIHTKE